MYYASVIDWNWKDNIIRANPNFHQHPRYDYALVQVNGNECVFVQVLFIFSTRHLDRNLNLALVLPFDVPKLPANRSRDDALRLTRLCPRRQTETVVINVDTVIRGGLLAPDLASRGGEFLVVDVIDEDMWMRLKDVEFVTRARI